MNFLCVNLNHICASQPDKLEGIYRTFLAAQKVGEAHIIHEGFFAPIVCFNCKNSPDSATELLDSFVARGLPKVTLKVTKTVPANNPFTKQPRR